MARGSVSVTVTPGADEIVQGARSSEQESVDRQARVSAIAADLSQPKPAYSTEAEREEISR